MRSILLFLLVLGYVAADNSTRIPQQMEYHVITANLKTPAHPYYGQGFAVGLDVDGIENTDLVFYVGRNYTFIVNCACNHPVYISTDPSGQGAGEVREGISDVTNNNYNQVCGGVNFTWSPSEDQVGTTFYYQCRTHSKMGWKIQVTDEPICDKYSRLLKLTNYQLIYTVVVDQVFKNLTTQNVLTNPLIMYFNGQLNAGGNYSDPANAASTTALANHLVEFFGAALGCPDPLFPAYDGNPNLQSVHAALPIGKIEFDDFNQVVINSMAADGVSSEDQATVLGVLESLSNDICNDPDSCKNSICDRYSVALGLTNVQLVTAVVTGTFNAAVMPGSLIEGFFNGTVPAGSIDFVTNAAQKSRLFNDLVGFFGQTTILGCTDTDYPAYNASTDLHAIHQDMPIGTAEFEAFNSDLIGVLKASGVSVPDQNAVYAILESTKSAVCNQPDCTGNMAAGITFVFDVVPKVHHPFTGMGFPSGFEVDGLEGRPLNLVVGVVYTFTNNGICSHPLYITSSEIGAGADEVDTGVTFPGGDPYSVCGGKSLTFTPAASEVGTTLYYQCRNHMYMGYTISVYTSQSNIPVTTGSGTVTLGAPATLSGAVSTTGGSTASTTAAAEGSAYSLVPSILLVVAMIAMML